MWISFFHPVILIDLIEIIITSNTPELLIYKLKEFSKNVGKKSLVVKDGPGSVINAILLYYYVEAIYLVEEGLASPSRIDACARSFFYVGPFESIDVIGIDLFLHALNNVSGPLTPLRNPKPGQENLSQEELGGKKDFISLRFFLNY